MDKEFLSKRQAASYLDVPVYVLTTLDRIGRMGPDKVTLFGKYYSVRRLDDYKRDASVDVWKNDDRILSMIKRQKTAF